MESLDPQILAGIPLFKTLPLTELQGLAGEMFARALQPGEVLFREGEPGHHFYVLTSGRLEIVKALGTPDERVVAERKPGDFIGEMSLVNPDGQRTASVRTSKASQVWEMSRDQFNALVQRHPEFSYEMVRVLSARLTASQARTIEDLREKNEELGQAYDALKAAQQELIEKERMERELQLATEIQMSLLPQELPDFPGYRFGALLNPARAVGGDFYDFVPLGADRLGIFIGDVTDKGVPSAIYMAQVNALLLSQAVSGLAPGAVVRRVNELLLQISAASLFTTVLYGVLDQEKRNFTYARAGHESPIRVDKTGVVEVLPIGLGQPLGLFDDPAIDEGVVALNLGDSLLLYTDGVTDLQDPSGEILGIERFLALAVELAGAPAAQMCESLWERLTTFRAGAPKADDLTLVVVQVIGKK